MKKILFYLLTIILFFFMIVSCSNEKRKYTLVYKVYYSANHVIEKTATSADGFQVGSNKGSNYIYNLDNGDCLIDTSAPIEIVSNTYILLNN